MSTTDSAVEAAGPDRLIAYKAHGLSGKWRTRKVRFGAFVIEVELSCINGLPAWFHVASFPEADEAERLMTDGAKLEAGEYAEHFVSLISQVEKMREALKPFAEIALARDSMPAAPDMIDGPDIAITAAHVRRARAALNPKE